MNNKVKGALAVLLILALTAGFCILGVHGAKDIKLGLDLNGGVSITYQTVEETRRRRKCPIPFISSS